MSDGTQERVRPGCCGYFPHKPDCAMQMPEAAAEKHGECSALNPCGACLGVLNASLDKYAAYRVAAECERCAKIADSFVEDEGVPAEIAYRIRSGE